MSCNKSTLILVGVHQTTNNLPSYYNMSCNLFQTNQCQSWQLTWCGVGWIIMHVCLTTKLNDAGILVTRCCEKEYLSYRAFTILQGFITRLYSAPSVNKIHWFTINECVDMSALQCIVNALFLGWVGLGNWFLTHIVYV